MSTLLTPQAQAAADAGPVAADELALRRRFFNRRTLLSFLIAIGLLAFLLARYDLDFNAVWAQVRAADLPALALAVAVYFATFPVRGLRWRLLLTNVGVSRAQGLPVPSIAGLSEIILLGWFANCIVPAKLGDAYRAYLLKKNAATSFSTTAGTIVAERLVDMTVLFGLLCISAVGLAGISHDRVAAILLLGFVMFAGIVGGIGAMRMFGERLHRYLPAQLRPMYLRFHAGTLGSFRQLPLVAALTILVWLMEGTRLLLVTRALGLSLDFHFVLFASLANSLLTVVPFTPGGLGLVENGLAELLLRTGVAKETAFSVVLLDRGISYWMVVGAGLITFVFTRKK